MAAAHGAQLELCEGSVANLAFSLEPQAQAVFRFYVGLKNADARALKEIRYDRWSYLHTLLAALCWLQAAAKVATSR
jgi:hypothetical protein